MSAFVCCALVALWVWVNWLVRMGILLLRAWAGPWITSVWASVQLRHWDEWLWERTRSIHSTAYLWFNSHIFPPPNLKLVYFLLMWITHCGKTSLPWNHSVLKVINGWQQSLDSEVNCRAYLPGLFNHSWLFVASHLLMMRRGKAELHILALTLQMFLTLSPLRSRRLWIK